MEPDSTTEAASTAEMPTGIPEESNTKEISRMRSSL